MAKAKKKHFMGNIKEIERKFDIKMKLTKKVLLLSPWKQFLTK